MSDRQEVAYFVFDIESVADGDLISRVKYPKEKPEPDLAIQQFREELLEDSGGKRDFIPYTFQIPTSVVIAKVSRDFALLDLVSLDEPKFRPHVMTEQFWRGWEVYKKPTWVSFNGRSFDMPLMELAAFRYGIGLPHWFNTSGRTYDQPRNRYNQNCHLDLLDVLTNFGASRFHGGLNLAAEILGKPGKMAVEGFMVQELFQQGKQQAISDYCRCDVLDTYFVFLRCAVLRGELTLDREQAVVAEAKKWIEARAATDQACRDYLDGWSAWPNPW